MAQFHKLEIQDITKETADAVSITFKVPDNLKSEFKFKAGQYITLKADIKGNDVRRAYSICSDPNSDELKVAVKAVEGGTFSVFANNSLKVGDVLEVMKPEGRFILESANNEHYIAFAAGSGITPILSMIKDSLHNNSTFTLIYGNKSENDTIFKNQLDTLKEMYGTRLNIHYIFSREEVQGSLAGRIDEDTVNHFVNKIYKNTSFHSAYICGPEEMIKKVSASLTENSFAQDAIYYELFSTPVEVNQGADIPEGNSEITIVLDDEETTFIMPQKKTILEVALKKDLDAPYSCQGGICSSCLAKITEGEATMERNEILTDDEIRDGLVLTCQAHPTTPRIKIDFDDV